MVGEVSWGVGCQHGHIGRWSFSDYSPNNSEAFLRLFQVRNTRWCSRPIEPTSSLNARFSRNQLQGVFLTDTPLKVLSTKKLIRLG